MKTAIIFNEMEEIKYYVLDGDFTKFHGIYINSMDADEELVDKLASTFYDDKTGEELKEPIALSEFVAAIRDGAEVIEIGFIP